MSFRVGFEPLAWVRHHGYGCLEIRVKLGTHCGNDSCSQPGSFVKTWPGSGHAENIRSQLHGGIALAAAAGNPQVRDRDTAPLLSAVLSLSQGIGQPFQNGTVDVSPGVHIAKTDNSTARLGPG